MNYRFLQDGDFVNFWDDNYHVLRVHNSSRIVTWYYNDTGGLVFKLDTLNYQVDDVADISFGGVALTTQAEFEVKIKEFFPGYESGGSGEIPGIDDVLNEEQTVTSRFIEVQANGLLEIITSGSRNLLEFDTTENDERSSLEANNLTGLGNKGRFLASTTPTVVSSEVLASLNADQNTTRFEAYTSDEVSRFTIESFFGEKEASIIATVSVDSSGVQYNADTHTFNGGILVIDSTAGGQTFVFNIDDGFEVISEGTTFIHIDAVPNSEQSLFQAVNPTGNGNYGRFKANVTQNDAQSEFAADFNDGVGLAKIVAIANETGGVLTHTADTHTFNINGILSAVFGGNTLLFIDPTPGNESASLTALNTTDNDNVAAVGVQTSNTDATVNLISNFNDGVKSAQISAFADASTSSITHTADTHQFNGNLYVNGTLVMNGTGPTIFKMVSPDASVWQLSVSNAGVLEINPD